MFGLLIVAFATLVDEIGSSIGKANVLGHKESVYTMGFLNILWGTVFIFGVLLFVPPNFFAPGFPGGFIFALASLPTFLLRAVLEVFQLHVTLKAVVVADRSTFGFLRIVTIPLLLGVDILLGYPVDLFQAAGIGFIIFSLAFLFMNHGIRRRGAVLVLLSGVNAVLTVSLYKYNITHFNSVEAEQGIILLILLVYCFILARSIAKENPLRFLMHPVFLTQSVTRGFGTVIMSFVFLILPASIIMTGKRSMSVLWSMLAGNVYFREKHIFIKVVAFVLLVTGLVFLAL